MIKVSGVSKRFPNGTLALDAASTDIRQGDFVALLGPSGCGKSTLLRLIAGLEKPTSGQIIWQDGAPTPGEIGFVFQDATLMPWASAAENVFLPLKLRRKSRAATQTEVSAALAQVGLTDFANSKPAALSGGMKMRVSIARALVSQPKLLLMDEPFGALDEFTRHRLQEDLRALWQRSGKTIIFVTHSIYEAAFLATRVLVMSARPGRISTSLDCHINDAEDRRTAPDYIALVKRLSDLLRQEFAA
jgi:NitT/TauT family transport system ATP-binding protein